MTTMNRSNQMTFDEINRISRLVNSGEVNESHLDEMKKFGQIMSGKIVTLLIGETLAYVLKDTPDVLAETEKHMTTISNKCPVDFVGNINFMFEGTFNYILKLTLCLVSRDFVLDMSVPAVKNQDTMMENLRATIANLLRTAIIYYNDLITQDPATFNELRRLVPAVDWTRIRVDNANKTLYLHADVPKRVCVFSFYVDKTTGKPVGIEDS